MLTLEVEFLSGVCYAGVGNDKLVEWPLQPDRAFSALVAAWGARGQDDAEREVLKWLERQPTPIIAASAGFARSAVDVFVPPNDDSSGKVGSLSVMPRHRRRQPRRFPAFRPNDAVMRIVWPVDPDDTTLERLDALAGDLSYFGHSTSLVRARFLRSDDPPKGVPAKRVPFDGRLEELERAFHRGLRPPKGALVIPIDPGPAASASIFSREWIVLPGMQGTPDARAFPIVAKRIRDTLMASYGRHGHDVPEWISGHTHNGSATRLPHLAIVPMLDVGHRFAASGIVGVGLVPPAHVENALEEITHALLRLRADGLMPPQMIVQGDGLRWHLAFTDDDPRESLTPLRWIARADGSGSRTWATVTPLVLDRHPHARGDDERQREVESLIADAVEHIGLPRPASVIADKHSAVEGAVAAYPSASAPPWTRWNVPSSFAGRRLTHAWLRFAEPVRGPLIIGSGRFVGLGMCMPLERGVGDE